MFKPLKNLYVIFCYLFEYVLLEMWYLKPYIDSFDEFENESCLVHIFICILHIHINVFNYYWLYCIYHICINIYNTIFFLKKKILLAGVPPKTAAKGGLMAAVFIKNRSHKFTFGRGSFRNRSQKYFMLRVEPQP